MKRDVEFRLQKVFALFPILTLTAALWACGPVSGQTLPEAVVQAEPPSVTDTLPEESSAPAPQTAPDAASAEALLGLLQAIAEHYQPGTAGCSLQAAKYAGMLLDWNAEAHMGEDGIAETAKQFYESLDSEAARLFSEEQLTGVFDAAWALLSDTALDYLDSAGYRPADYPWSQDAVRALFVPLFTGVGREISAE